MNSMYYWILIALGFLISIFSLSLMIGCNVTLTFPQCPAGFYSQQDCPQVWLDMGMQPDDADCHAIYESRDDNNDGVSDNLANPDNIRMMECEHVFHNSHKNCISNPEDYDIIGLGPCWGSGCKQHLCVPEGVGFDECFQEGIMDNCGCTDITEGKYDARDLMNKYLDACQKQGSDGSRCSDNARISSICREDDEGYHGSGQAIDIALTYSDYSTNTAKGNRAVELCECMQRVTGANCDIHFADGYGYGGGCAYTDPSSGPNNGAGFHVHCDTRSLE